MKIVIDWQKTAFLFPGQGSQAIGMGAGVATQYPNARQVYTEADRLLGVPLSKLCFDGPADELDDTYNTQPALFVTSMALLEALSPPHNPAMMAGHSMGELSALVAAKAISFEDGLHLVRERGRLMREAGEKSPGAMAAILGLEINVLQAICEDATQRVGKPLVIANDNCPGQVVISGDSDTLDYALPIIEQKGARRAVKLAVSVAAHSPLMEHSAAAFQQVVETTPIITPQIPVIGNANAAPLHDADMIRAELNAQLTSPVRWTESIHFMLNQGIDTFVEIGPKGVLKGLLRRIDRSVTCLTIEAPEDITSFMKSLS